MPHKLSRSPVGVLAGGAGPFHSVGCGKVFFSFFFCYGDAAMLFFPFLFSFVPEVLPGELLLHSLFHKHKQQSSFGFVSEHLSQTEIIVSSITLPLKNRHVPHTQLAIVVFITLTCGFGQYHRHINR